MKLHEVPDRTWVKILPDETGSNPRVPPAAPLLTSGEVVFFDHIDGMYSFCKNKVGTVVHLVAWAEVEILAEQPKAPK